METNTSETMGTSVATFTVDPVAGGTQAQVTIETQSQSRDGLAGVIERFLGRLFLQRVYAQELARLAVCAEGKTRTGHMPSRHRAQRAPAMKIFGRGFSLSDADLFLSATIRVDPRPIFPAA